MGECVDVLAEVQRRTDELLSGVYSRKEVQRTAARVMRLLKMLPHIDGHAATRPGGGTVNQETAQLDEFSRSELVVGPNAYRRCFEALARGRWLMSLHGLEEGDGP